MRQHICPIDTAAAAAASAAVVVAAAATAAADGTTHCMIAIASVTTAVGAVAIVGIGSIPDRDSSSRQTGQAGWHCHYVGSISLNGVQCLYVCQ